MLQCYSDYNNKMWGDLTYPEMEAVMPIVIWPWQMTVDPTNISFKNLFLKSHKED